MGKINVILATLRQEKELTQEQADALIEVINSMRPKTLKSPFRKAMAEIFDIN